MMMRQQQQQPQAPINTTTTTTTTLTEKAFGLSSSRRKSYHRDDRRHHHHHHQSNNNKNNNKYDLNLILIDHYDSFTYNLYDMFAQLCVNPPIVLAKDSFDDWSQVVVAVEEIIHKNNNMKNSSSSSSIDGIILSPGPGTPTNPNDIGTLSPSIIKENPDLPILGVCLGHQIIGHVYGANVDLCGPVHGQVRTIERTTAAATITTTTTETKTKTLSSSSSSLSTDDDDYDYDYDEKQQQQQQQRLEYHQNETENDPLWKDIPARFNVTRYHSLAVTLPNTKEQQQQQQQQQDIPAVLLRPTAYSGDHDHDHDHHINNRNHHQHDDEEGEGGKRILMGMSHKINPHYGIQFHPESIGSEYGHQLIRNFCDICSNRKQQQAVAEAAGRVVLEKTSNLNGDESTLPTTATTATTTNVITDKLLKSRDEVPPVAAAAAADPFHVHDRKGEQRLPGRMLRGQQHEDNNNGIIQKRNGGTAAAATTKLYESTTSSSSDDVNPPPKSKYQVFVHRIPRSTMTADLTPLEVFEEFLSQEQYSVWLDTSIGVQSATAAEEESAATDATTTAASPSYSSIMGAGRNTVEYYGKEYDGDQEQRRRGLYCYDYEKDCTVRSTSHDDILTYLQEEYRQATDSITMVDFGPEEEDGTTKVSKTVMAEDEVSLPFDFRGGHVGYLGYEVRHDSERFLEEEERGSREKWKPLEGSLLSPPLSTTTQGSKTNNKQGTPTAAFLFLDRSWVYDHSTNDWYLLSLVDAADDSMTDQRTVDGLEWMRSTALRMKGLGNKNDFVVKDAPPASPLPRSTREQQQNTMSKKSAVKFTPNRSRLCYNQNFADCQEQIRLGESYELCLTNQLEADVRVPSHSSPLELYKMLRKRNPAPFSAFLNWNISGCGENSRKTSSSSSMAVCCSSPERFVSVKRVQNLKSRGMNWSHDDGETLLKLQVEAKPIKGTCARVIPDDPTVGMCLAEAEEDRRRAAELQESVKNRAENLMIVDLLRNDLSRVCEVGSVHVSKLMDIESYATVHQMVSTIRGTLDRAKVNSVDVLKATFPGGSMTGAPKIRTMEILERLEEGVSRGPYSGCLGYISMNGSMDMNIVIRSAVLTPKAAPTTCSDDDEETTTRWKVSIGAGGAITALSESTDEYEEMILKASAVMRAVGEWAESSTGTTSALAVIDDDAS